jgi:hypothetical protein
VPSTKQRHDVRTRHTRTDNGTAAATGSGRVGSGVEHLGPRARRLHRAEGGDDGRTMDKYELGQVATASSADSNSHEGDGTGGSRVGVHVHVCVSLLLLLCFFCPLSFLRSRPLLSVWVGRV